jgi:hypothetical protein
MITRLELEMADYAGVLEDLRTRRQALAREAAELETAIAALERLSGVTPSGPAVLATNVAVFPPSLRGLTMPQAVDKYLRWANRPVTTREVQDGLKAGGVSAEAKSFSNQVYNTLHRMWKVNGTVNRNGNEWTLTAQRPERALFIREEAH